MYARGVKLPQRDVEGNRVVEAPLIRFERYAEEGTSPRATAAALAILGALLEQSMDKFDESDRGGAKERIVFDKGLMRLVSVSNADQGIRTIIAKADVDLNMKSPERPEITIKVEPNLLTELRRAIGQNRKRGCVCERSSGRVMARLV